MTAATELASGATPAGGRDDRRRRINGAGIVPLLVAVVVLGVVGAVSTAGFASVDNIRAIVTSASITGIAAVGMTFVTLSGNYFSLALQQTAVMAGLLFLSTVRDAGNAGWAALLAISAVLAIGVLQGVVVALGMNTIITTLAVGSIIFGVMSAVTSGRTVSAGGADLGLLGNTLILGVPPAVYGFVLATVAASAVASRTGAGRRTTLLGANRKTARLSGIRVMPTTVFAFLMMSIGVAIAGILSAAQLKQASANDLATLTTDVVAAVLVGGTAIGGGFGSPLRSALGAVTIAILNNLMVLNGFSIGWRLTIQGALVVAVISVLHVLSRGRR